MNYAMFADHCPDDYLPIIKELLQWDAVALDCCDLVRGEQGILGYRTLPSSLHWSRQTEWPWAILNARLEPHHTCLEVGGAGCVMKYPVAKRCKHVVVADINEEDMHHTAKAVELLGVNNITQVLGDARFLPYPDNWFDRVFCISVLEHMPHGYVDAAQEMARVLKPGGKLLLSMDVVVRGEAGKLNNFFVTLAEVTEILKGLGIDRVSRSPNPIQGYFAQEQIVLEIVLVEYTKPGA